MLVVLGVAAHGLNGQVSAGQLHLHILFLAAGQIHCDFIAGIGLLDIGLHHIGAMLAKDAVRLPIHGALQSGVIPERIEEIIKQIFMKNSGHQHKSFLQSRLLAGPWTGMRRGWL